MALKSIELWTLTSTSESGLIYIIQSNKYDNETRALAKRILASNRANAIKYNIK